MLYEVITYILRSDSHSRIGERQDYVIALMAGGNRDCALRRDRMDRIHQDIHEHLVELVGEALHGGS